MRSVGSAEVRELDECVDFAFRQHRLIKFFKWIKQHLRIKRVLRHLGEPGEDPDLDSCVSLRAGRHRQEATLEVSLYTLLQVLRSQYSRKCRYSLRFCDRFDDTEDRQPLKLFTFDRKQCLGPRRTRRTLYRWRSVLSADRLDTLMNPLISHTGPKTSAKRGCCCSMREKRCISGPSQFSDMFGIRS